MKFVYLTILVLLTLFSGKLLIDAGVHLDIKSVPATCSKIEGIQGPEDIEIIDHKLFISSTYLPYRHSFQRGSIYLIDLEKTRLTPQKVSPPDFFLSPHGIQVKKFNDIISIWAVNHLKGKDTIELFNFINGKLVHRKTFKSEHYINANDIAVIDEERFIVSHDHGSTNDSFKKLEDYSRLGQGYLTYFDGKKTHKLPGTYNMPNGIQFKKNKVFLSQMLGKKLTVFNFDKGKLTLSKEISLPYAPDNISINNNEILIATHPKLLDLKSHAYNKANNSPSIILSMDIETLEYQVIFQDNGELISGSSVAVRSKVDESLFIGNIYNNFLLKCGQNAN